MAKGGHSASAGAEGQAWALDRWANGRSQIADLQTANAKWQVAKGPPAGDHKPRYSVLPAISERLLGQQCRQPSHRHSRRIPNRSSLARPRKAALCPELRALPRRRCARQRRGWRRTESRSAPDQQRAHRGGDSHGDSGGDAILCEEARRGGYRGSHGVFADVAVTATEG